METFVGDTIKIVLKTGIDLSLYGSLQIMFRRPDGSTGAWDATLSTDDDEWMEYSTLESDLDIPGTWALQSHVFDPGIELHGKWTDIIVFTPTLEPVIVP